MESTKQNLRSRASGWPLAVYWTLTYISSLPFILITALLARQFFSEPDRAILMWVNLGSALVFAFLLGVLQKVVMQNYIRVGWQWVRATMIGIIVLGLLYVGVFLASRITPALGSGPYFEIAPSGWALAWAITGVAQYLILRAYVQRAGWWIVTNIVALLAGFLFGSVIFFFSPYPWWPELGLHDNIFESPLAWIASVLLAMLTAGAIMGASLAWLLKQVR